MHFHNYNIMYAHSTLSMMFVFPPRLVLRVVLAYAALWVPHISCNVIIFIFLLLSQIRPTCGFLVAMLFMRLKSARDVITKNGKVLSSYRACRVQEGVRRANGTRCREVIADLCYDMTTIAPIPFYRVEVVDGGCVRLLVVAGLWSQAGWALWGGVP
jgi:hypothetical protein